MNNQPLLILSFSPLDRDPRVQRQIRFLKGKYQITAAGYSHPEIRGIEFVKLPELSSSIVKKVIQALRLKSGRFESYYWHGPSVCEALRRLSGRKEWRLILSNDLYSLPLALKLARPCNAKVLLDAHEYEPRHFDDNWYFNYFFKSYWDYISRRYLPKVDAMTTVCRGIAMEYQNNYGVSCEVITNANEYHLFEPTKVISDRILMIHHGICHPSRRLENMIELMTLLDNRFMLDLMLVPNNRRYYRKLVALADGRPNIRIRRPVRMRAIVSTLNRYDIGIFLLSPKAFNYRMALPNKLFEFIQARLAVAIWPSPEMANIVTRYRVGIISDEFSIASAARCLNQLSTTDIQRFKSQSHATASILCAEQNRERLLDIVGEVIGERLCENDRQLF